MSDAGAGAVVGGDDAAAGGGRGAMRRWPRSPHTLALVVLAGLICYPLVLPGATYYQTVLLLAFLLAIQAMSWNIISGFTGYVSLGHSAFLGLGAYTAGILTDRLGVNPLVFAPLGGVVAVVAAVAVGVVVLRVRGHAFVIITIALLLAMQVAATNFDSLTEGSDGITLPLPPWPRDIQNIPFYYLFLALMVVTFGFSAWIRRTKFGTGLVAIRDDEGKAAAIGVNTTIYKVLAYAASALFIGVAGAVYAYFLTFLNPTGAFAILPSVAIVLAALAGGRGTLYGPLIGAFIVQFAGETATVYGGGEQARLLLFGPALVLVVMFLPHGLLPTLRRQVDKRRAAGRSVEFIDQSGALERQSIKVVDRAPAPEPDRPNAADRPLLEFRGVHKRFQGLRVLTGVDLSVRAGSITGLIGPNGSGKTTLFNLASGALRADAGEIVFAGRGIDRMPPWRRAHLGIGRTFQVTRLFPSMTVLRNVVAPMGSFSWSGLAAGAVAGHEAERARELLSFVGLARFADVPAGALSYGQLKLVELAQVLMIEPRMILLDEPASGVNPSLVARLVEIIKELNGQGITFLVVEHNIPLVLELCDPVATLSRGEIIATGPPAAVRADPAVLAAYLGTPAAESRRLVDTAPEGD
ncbi:MAG TPA: branched-chain amino acid ABC transporter ATP-binding protein/permease [Streptosporangiaceae bacterium]|nr:branched-chain amino acid ABC transporter ATP-binding protein/permease [Streptosporangiaceae bacterium]